MTGPRTATNRATPPSLGPKVALSPPQFPPRLSAASFLVSVLFLCLYRGVNIGGAGSYVYDDPVNEAPAAVSMETSRNPEEEKRAPARGPVKGGNSNGCWKKNPSLNQRERLSELYRFLMLCLAASFSSFSGGPNICPRCNKTVYFGEQIPAYLSAFV